ncbi:MAG TPA: hypothetical protein VE445_06530 [Nitrososphaeraceae archaeon]|nr:hypothetical protein [Nitrososphaeraceae archaeon]
MRLFQKKRSIFCSLCNKELKYKYKPAKEWSIEGYLCADCHINKTKEFIVRQQQYEEIPDNCIVCNKELKSESEKKKPRWQWNIESGSYLCNDCFEKKDLSYEKKRNFCSICNQKMGFIRYNPKPKWKIDGQLCKHCWDKRKQQEI